MTKGFDLSVVRGLDKVGGDVARPDMARSDIVVHFDAPSDLAGSGEATGLDVYQEEVPFYLLGQGDSSFQYVDRGSGRKTPQVRQGGNSAPSDEVVLMAPFWDGWGNKVRKSNPLGSFAQIDSLIENISDGQPSSPSFSARIERLFGLVESNPSAFEPEHIAKLRAQAAGYLEAYFMLRRLASLGNPQAEQAIIDPKLTGKRFLQDLMLYHPREVVRRVADYYAAGDSYAAMDLAAVAAVTPGLIDLVMERVVWFARDGQNGSEAGKYARLLYEVIRPEPKSADRFAEVVGEYRSLDTRNFYRSLAASGANFADIFGPRAAAQENRFFDILRLMVWANPERGILYVKDLLMPGSYFYPEAAKIVAETLILLDSPNCPKEFDQIYTPEVLSGAKAAVVSLIPHLASTEPDPSGRMTIAYEALVKLAAAVPEARPAIAERALVNPNLFDIFMNTAWESGASAEVVAYMFEQGTDADRERILRALIDGSFSNETLLLTSLYRKSPEKLEASMRRLAAVGSRQAVRALIVTIPSAIQDLDVGWLLDKARIGDQDSILLAAWLCSRNNLQALSFFKERRTVETPSIISVLQTYWSEGNPDAFTVLTLWIQQYPEEFLPVAKRLVEIVAQYEVLDLLLTMREARSDVVTEDFLLELDIGRIYGMAHGTGSVTGGNPHARGALFRFEKYVRRVREARRQ